MDPFGGFLRNLWREMDGPDLVPGQLVRKRFTLLRELGGGGQGVVWAAWDEALGRVVALKFSRGGPAAGDAPPRDEATRPWQPADLEREARNSARLNLQNAIRVYDYHPPVGGTPAFLVMEFAAGGKLSNWSGRFRGPAEVRRLAGWMVALLEPLRRMHDEGLGHGDVKPDNVLLCEDAVQADGRPPADLRGPDPATADLGRFHPKLADLGLAAAGTGDTSRGTLGYAAPEQWDTRVVTPSTDQFGAGATLYRMLAGEVPVPTDGTPYAGPAEGPLAAAGVPRELRRIVLKALAADPKDRYGSAAAFGDDLDAWANGRPTSFTSTTWQRTNLFYHRLPRGGKNLFKGLAAAVLLVAGLLVGIAGLGFYAARKAEEAKGALGREFAAQMEATEAKTQQDAAERERLVAEREMERNGRLTGARLLAQNGKWEDALPAYGRLIGEVPAPLASALRAERLHGYLATHRLADFARELDDLAALPAGTLGPAEAVVRLYEAERLSWFNPAKDEVGGEFQAALARADEAFKRHAVAAEGDRPRTWAADNVYLAALRAASDQDYLDGLKTVLAYDPNHYPALRSLAVATAARRAGPASGRGRPDAEPGRYSARLKETHPRSPARDFATGLVDTVDRAVPADPARWDVARELTAENKGRLADLLANVARARVLVRSFRPLTPRGEAPEATRTALTKLASRGGDIARLAGHVLPALGIPYRAFEPVPQSYQAFDYYSRAMFVALEAAPDERGPKRDFAVGHLRAIAAEMAAEHARTGGSAALLVGEAFVRFLAIARFGEIERPSAVAKAKAILDLTVRSEPCPALLSDSPLVQHVLYTSVLSAANIARLHPEGEALLPGLEDLMPLLVRRLRADPMDREDFLRMLVRALRPYTEENDLRVEKGLWKTDTEPGRIRADDRLRYLANLVAYPLIGDWIIQCERRKLDPAVPKAMRREVDAFFNKPAR